jgi:hypothetical protein
MQREDQGGRNERDVVTGTAYGRRGNGGGCRGEVFCTQIRT